jgi:arginine decarboxylase
MTTESSATSTSSSLVGQRSPNPPALPDGYHIEEGRLHLHGLDLASLADYWMTRAGQEDAPLTIRYMPSVRTKFQKARDAFEQATRQTNYPGTVRLAYASKANPNHAVIKAAMGAGADYECSSRVDVSIVRYAIEQGWLTPDRLIIANGFKTPGYADALIGVAQAGHPGVIPVFDSIEEVQHFADSGIALNVGMRYRVSGHNERFGMDEAELFETQQLIAESPNLTLVLFHALQLFPAIDNPEYVASLENAIEVFKRLRVCCPSLHWFDVGGGLPTQLAEPDDLQEWMVSIQQMALRHCGMEHAPDLIIESGRYLTGSHQLEAFKVVKTKVVNGVTYYVLGGGIMSNLPDAWALGAEFPVAALNHCDSPYHDVRLAGLTCDPDDVYPPKRDKFVSLPQDADGLLVAFLEIGAYQDMLGGEGGAKHCLLSEGATILIGDDPDYPTRITYQPPQSIESVLSHLGYGQEPFSAF